MQIKDIVIYAFIIIVLIVAIVAENKDINCIDSKVCGVNKGKAYYYYTPLDSDTREQLREKLLKSTRYEFNSTSWRRCMIVAILSAFIGLLIIQQGLPDGTSLGIMVLVIFTFAYFIHLNYQQTIGIPATNQIIAILNRIP